MVNRLLRARALAPFFGYRGFHTLISLWMAGCLSGFLLSCIGGSSETSNGDLQARGKVVYSDGTPAARVTVLLVDGGNWGNKVAEGVPVVLDSIQTDSRGFFQVDMPDSLRCNLQIAGKGEGLFLQNLKGVRKEDSPISMRLAAFGSITGHAKVDSPSSVIELRLFGTAYTAPLGESGSFYFAAIAPGTFEFAAQVKTDIGRDTVAHTVRVEKPVEVRSKVEVKDENVSLPAAPVSPVPNDSVQAKSAYPDWPHALTIAIPYYAAPLKLSAIPADLAEFPYCIRLDSTHFPVPTEFSNFIKGFRISGRDGKPRSYETVTLDTVGRHAEVWVLAKTLADGPDSITIHWGKPGASDSSSPEALFGGFLGVWHMSDFTQTQPGLDLGLPIAVPHDLRSNGYGMEPNFSIPGHLGQALVFNRLNQRIDVFDSSFISFLSGATAFTLSAWIRAGAADTLGSAIVSWDLNFDFILLPDGNLRFSLINDSVWTPIGKPYLLPYAKICSTKALNLLDDRWHHVAAVFDGMDMRLYVDGSEAAALARPGKLRFLQPLQTTGFLNIGYGYATDGFKNDYRLQFAGVLDEVRLKASALSPSRIFTDYESQKPAP